MGAEQYKARRLSRREFLKVAASTAASVILAGCEMPKSRGVPQPAPVRLPEELTKEEKFVLDDVVIYADGLGLPTRYVLPGGSTVYFDRGEMLGVRLRAITLTKEGNAQPQFIKIIDLGKKPDSKTPFKATVDRPRTWERPSDILSSAELERYGTSIIQGREVSLFIRRVAFEKDGPLFEQAEFFRKTGNKLTIVLVDGPAVLTDYMGEARYDSVRNLLVGRQQNLSDVDVLSFKAKKIGEMKDKTERDLKDLRGYLGSGGGLSSEIGKREKEFADGAITLYAYENVFSIDLLRVIMAKPGLFVGSTLRFGEREIPKDSAIFMAVGREERRLLSLYFGVKGDCRATISVFGPNFVPRPDQTFPRPEDYEVENINCMSSPDEYPLGAQDLGQSFLHEIEHLRRWTRKFLADPNLGELNEGECWTDKRSLDWISNAFSRWRSSGFKDNSGYFFVWSIPEGGYIYTKDESRQKV